ncbi:MAG: hypothetical protein AB7P04_01530 [Bacteriovoracia bacterium]
MSRYFVGIGLSLVLACASACREAPTNNDPKNRLKEYIHKTFNVRSVDERKDLMSYLVGDAKTRLETWSDDQFELAFMSKKRQNPVLVFKETRKASDDEVNITYEINYSDRVNNSEAKVTNKKICYLVRQKDDWFIRECRNLKELIEYQNEMSLP